ncbi:MAG: hypothetical protein HFE90_07130 [Firmicutes bacterium]|nr:hypothetical protein [Bacillota bacterium]
MESNNKIGFDEVYISERLENRLKFINNYPLTVIEAPIGYGKTTAIREYLKRSSGMYIWYSVMDSCEDYFWKQFCISVGKIDKEIAGKLEETGFPKDAVSACDAADILKDIDIKKDIVFVIDDYQLIFSEKLNRFFEIVARNNIAHLHIILIGRNKFTSSREELEIKNLLFVLTEYDFKLDEMECRKYFNVCGLDIGRSESHRIFMQTEGWITAVRIALMEYTNEMQISVRGSLFNLFENSVYRNYTDDEKDFLMRICIFSKFSGEQARFVRRKHDPYEILNKIVESNGFIRYDEKLRRYYIHNMFSKFLKEKLYKMDLKYRNEVYRHAADWHYLNGEFFLATCFYYKSGNFEDMLKTFIRDRGSNLSGRSGKTMIAAFKACPDHIKNKYPMAIMIYTKQLAMMNERELLKENIAELKGYFDSDNLTKKEKEEFTGEYYMLMSFLAYNNINKMNEYYKMAAKFLKKASSLEDSRGNWTCGAPSVLYMFYNEVGGLDRVTEELHKSRDLYYKLTDNNGRGGEYILDGERKFFRGHLDRAEILSFKAYNVAKKYDQAGIMICALFLQARIAMFQGDAEKGINAINKLREIVAENDYGIFTHTADICKGFIYAIYSQLKPIEEWILEGKFDDISLYNPAMNFLYITYGKILIERGEYSKLLGCTDYYIAEAAEDNNILTVIYMRIYETIAYDKMGMTANSMESMRKAVQFAVADHIYVPFVENGKALFSCEDENIYADEEVRFINNCRNMYKKYEKNLNMLLKEEDASPFNMLTKREKEIALLVSDGNTNMQIAKELNIAEITVKKSLSNIYARLGITNRASLSKQVSLHK